MENEKKKKHRKILLWGKFVSTKESIGRSTPLFSLSIIESINWIFLWFVSLPISILSLFLQILDQSSLLNLLGLFETECVYCPTLPRLYQFDKLYIFCSVVLLTVQHLEMNDIIHLQFYKTSTGKRCYS